MHSLILSVVTTLSSASRSDFDEEGGFAVGGGCMRSAMSCKDSDRVTDCGMFSPTDASLGGTSGGKSGTFPVTLAADDSTAEALLSGAPEASMLGRMLLS